MLTSLRAATARGLARLRDFARRIKLELRVWRRVLKHPRTPWYAKALLGFAILYALMPFDLIPDFIPVLGLLDDLLLVAVPISLALKLVRRDVIRECRELAS